MRFWASCATLIVGVLFAGAQFGSGYYRLPAPELARQAVRVVATPVLAQWYRADLDERQALVAAYQIGHPARVAGSARESWDRATRGTDLHLHALTVDRLPVVPFVYESKDEAFLRTAREAFELDRFATASLPEYDAMLAMAAWIGTRWDHGTDPLQGSLKVCDPVAVVHDAARGAKYWCEVAARTTVHLAAAVGWPGRVVTGSRDGYTWEHAVAELWSNQFNKWFAVDTDFNVVFERDGVPLSAFELSTEGPELQRRGHLVARQFAPSKPSLPLVDLMPFYAYVHVDMRNDWCVRPLRPGSPAGGDLATWWTARPELRGLLTSRVRTDDRGTFDWPLNTVGIHVTRVAAADRGQLGLDVDLVAYSPVFGAFEVSIDDGAWTRVDGHALRTTVPPGRHRVRARVRTVSGHAGPVSELTFAYTPASAV